MRLTRWFAATGAGQEEANCQLAEFTALELFPDFLLDNYPITKYEHPCLRRQGYLGLDLSKVGEGAVPEMGMAQAGALMISRSRAVHSGRIGDLIVPNLD